MRVILLGLLSFALLLLIIDIIFILTTGAFIKFVLFLVVFNLIAHLIIGDAILKFILCFIIIMLFVILISLIVFSIVFIISLHLHDLPCQVIFGISSLPIVPYVDQLVQVLLLLLFTRTHPCFCDCSLMSSISNLKYNDKGLD